MAEVVSKTNLFHPCFHNHRRVSAFPNRVNNSASFSSSLSRGFGSFKLKSLSLRSIPSSGSDFYGGRVVFEEAGGYVVPKRPNFQPPHAQMGLAIGKAHRWWEKGLQPNMKEITGAQDLVDSLLNAGDKLVVLDFFSPGCGGCKALHPKICQLAEMNPDVQFLQVNYEEHKSMCYSLNVHVLPFFRFYRGVHGRLCSFSCTNATIKKFKDALAKHKTDQSSLGPPKGLEEKELIALSSNRDLDFKYSPKPVTVPEKEAIVAGEEGEPHEHSKPPLPLPSASKTVLDKENTKILVTAER